MPKLRLIKDDPALKDIIPFPSAADRAGFGGRLGRVTSPDVTSQDSTRAWEQELLGTIDRMQNQLDDLADMVGPYPLYPEDDRPTAA